MATIPQPYPELLYVAYESEDGMTDPPETGLVVGWESVRLPGDDHDTQRPVAAHATSTPGAWGHVETVPIGRYFVVGPDLETVTEKVEELHAHRRRRRELAAEAKARRVAAL